MQTWEQLYEANRGVLERYVYFHLPTREDGEDVLQETLLRAFRQFDTLRDKTKFQPWILRIAKNECAQFYRRRQNTVPLEEAPPSAVSLWGRDIVREVHETLDSLPHTQRELLERVYLQGVPQKELARELAIPPGTVKSRLHAARQQFRAAYETEREIPMKQLPKLLPVYTITHTDAPPFAVTWEEMMGWFAVPRLGESCAWAMYDLPGRNRTEQYFLTATCRAAVHGIEGIEIFAKETTPEGQLDTDRTFIVQLTDTHCRILSESHTEDGVKQHYTFLDADEFLPNWGFGEDNCGNEIHPVQKGSIRREGETITCEKIPSVLDVVGRYEVTINGKSYDTILVVDIENYNDGVMSETYLDKNGRTVLWRRFNADNWAMRRYGKPWTELLPHNERLFVNGTPYVHWYDCITDYIL